MEKSIHVVPVALPLASAVATMSQANAAPAVAPPALPELIATRQALFAIPFRIERSNDPAWQPVEAQLYVSTDRGAHWRLYKQATAERSRSRFAPAATASLVRHPHGRPIGPGAAGDHQRPGLRILVDTKPPVLRLTAQPGENGQVVVRWEIDEPNLNAEEPEYRLPPVAHRTLAGRGHRPAKPDRLRLAAARRSHFLAEAGLDRDYRFVRKSPTRPATRRWQTRG